MISPRILLLLTLAAAFPKNYCYSTRHTSLGTQDAPRDHPVHPPRHGIPGPRGNGLYFLQRNNQSPAFGGKLSKKGLQGGTSSVVVTPSHGQLHSPRHQVIVLTGNNVLSLGGSGSKDKKTGSTGGKINQVFVVLTNRLAVQHHGSEAHEHDLKKTLSVGGQAEILKSVSGIKMGEILSLEEIIKDQSLEAQNIILVVQDEASEQDRQTVDFELGKAESGELLLVDEAGVSLVQNIEEFGEDLTLVKDLAIGDVISAAESVQAGLLEEGTVVGQAVEKAVLLPIEIVEIAKDVLVGDSGISTDKNAEVTLHKQGDSSEKVIEAGPVSSSNLGEVVKEIGLTAQDEAFGGQVSKDLSISASDAMDIKDKP